MEPAFALLALNPHQARTAAAVFERLFPADEHGPGATEIGVLAYLDRALAGPDADHLETYRLGLAALDRAGRERWGGGFADGTSDAQDALLAALEREELPAHLFRAPTQGTFFDLLRSHLQEGLFADPIHGGNKDKLGWRVLGHPGVWLENSAEENLSADPVTKGGVIQSLADVGRALGGAMAGEPEEIPGYDPQRGTEPPRGRADVVLVGMGGVGGLIAPVLAKAGLRVVGLEAGPWRTKRDFAPDELGAAYWCRGNMGPKFLSETPRWRRVAGEPDREITFSLGRMMNGVGGSIVHYGAWLRRFHPHHFRFRSHALERWGPRAIPDGCTLADWPVTYDDLEPAFVACERIVGVTGDEGNPFVPRSTPYPMPPLRDFRLGELFRATTAAMGYHPHAVPAGLNSVPYDGRPATTYTAWSSGFGSFTDDKWHPGHSSVPAALATGDLDLRTRCRVLRVLTNGDGRATGVEYVDANGSRHVQEADVVLLCAYTYENVRLMFLSGDAKHPAGLGNATGQLGKHFMTKMFSHVDSFFPDVVFNRHTGPAAQAIVLDDLLAEGFDSVAHGFLGGATLGAENEFLPIAISREALPPDVPRWGSGYKSHIQGWQHWGVCRIQPDALSYEANFLDLHPTRRDRGGYGLPLVRVTYDLQPNEHRLAAWMEAKGAEILRRMGATKTWNGPRFTGAASSHDLGGCRMSDDPAAGVVDRELRVHDTPGLYVFSGAVFPTCPGVNPTMTLWALCLRAAERLADRMRRGEEV